MDKLEKNVVFPDLENGPIENVSAQALSVRISYIARIFRWKTMEQWEEFFYRNQNPKEQVSIWEAMAKAYSAFIKDRYLTPAMKKEAFEILFQ